MNKCSLLWTSTIYVPCFGRYFFIFPLYKPLVCGDPVASYEDFLVKDFRATMADWKLGRFLGVTSHRGNCNGRVLESDRSGGEGH